MRRLIPVIAVLALLPLVLSAPASAGPPLTTLTFTEVPGQPVHGLTVDGVTFGFQIGGVPSADARYNSFGPGSASHVQDPSLEGNSSGILALTFDRPTTVLEFGIARSCFCTLTPGVSVELLRPGADRTSSVIGATMSPIGIFAEARFAYNGPAIQTAVITFPSPGLAFRFALDNLTFHRVGAAD